jgi:hypothetical protein
MLKAGLHKPSRSMRELQREMLRKHGDKLLTPEEVAIEIRAHDRLKGRNVK